MNGILPEFLKAVLIIICVMVCIFLSRYAAGRFSSSVMRDVKREQRKTYFANSFKLYEL